MPEVMEAPAAVESSVSSGESSAEVSSQSTSDVDASSAAETTETTGETQQTADKTVTRANFESLLKDPAKKEALKAIDPSLPGLIRDAAFGAAQIKKEFPAGGLKEAIGYRDTLRSLGGPEAVRENMTALEDFHGLDQLYTEGKPEFVAQIAQGDPEAFERMVPIAIEHFAKQSPEAYQHVMSRVLVSTLDNIGLGRTLETLYQQAATPEAKASIQKLWDSVEGFRELAAKVPEKKIDPERQKLEQREKEFNDRQQAALRSEVARKSGEYRDTVIARELKPFADWSGLDDDRKAAIKREVLSRTAALVKADQAFIDRRGRLLANGDAQGVQDLEKQFFDQHLPQIVPRVAKLFWSNPGAKKVAQPDKNAPVAKKAQQGFQVVAKVDPSKVDRRATTRDMIMNNQAVYTDGRKVQWA